MQCQSIYGILRYIVKNEQIHMTMVRVVIMDVVIAMLQTHSSCVVEKERD